jgi:hypothetical protein
MRVFSELMERARRDDRIAASILPMKRRWREMVQTLLTEGVRDGVYRPDLDAESAAVMVIGAMVSFCRERRTDFDAYERLVAELKRAIRNPNSSRN